MEREELRRIVARAVRRARQVTGIGIKTAPGPERAVDGGRYSLDVAIKIIIDKYLSHLPLARQTRIMAQHGLDVTPQTLWDQLFFAVGRRLRSPSVD